MQISEIFFCRSNCESSNSRCGIMGWLTPASAKTRKLGLCQTRFSLQKAVHVSHLHEPACKILACTHFDSLDSKSQRRHDFSCRGGMGPFWYASHGWDRDFKVAESSSESASVFRQPGSGLPDKPLKTFNPVNSQCKSVCCTVLIHIWELSPCWVCLRRVKLDSLRMEHYLCECARVRKQLLTRVFFLLPHWSKFNVAVSLHF